MAAEGVTQLLPIPASRLHPKTKASIMHVRVMENLDAVQLSRCMLSFPFLRFIYHPSALNFNPV